MFNLKHQKINFQQLLGKGRFGPVYPYQKDQNDDRWVVKVQNCSSSELPAKIQEIVLGFSCNHANVLSIKGFHLDYQENKNKWEIYTKMPRMAGTLQSKLDRHIQDNTYFSEKEILGYFYDLVCGIEYLHQKKISHTDIKLDNIFLDKKGTAVISDVGMSNSAREDTVFLAPEVLEAEAPLNKQALYKADAWSLGVVVSELCLLKSKFLNHNVSGQQKEAQIVQMLEDTRGKYQDSSFISLVLKLVKHNPEQRANVEQVKKELEEKYGHILNIKKGVESHIEEHKTSEPIVELDPKVWKEKMEAVRKELAKSDGGLFRFKEQTYNHEVGVIIQPLDSLKVNDENVKKVIQDFTLQLGEQNWKQLKVLWVNLDHCEQITDNTVTELASQIGNKLNNLKCLALKFENCEKVTDKGVKDLAAQIPNLKGLESLRLYFQDSPKITDSGAQQLVSQVSSSLKRLQLFGLGLSKCNISDSTITHLTQHFQNDFKGLKELYIFLKHCSHITESAVLKLTNQIATSHKDLQLISLNLVDVTMSEKTKNSIKDSFNHLKDKNIHF